MAANQGAVTAQTIDDAAGEFNAANFHILQLISKIKTNTLVEIMPYLTGGKQIPGTVNVRPLVHLMSGNDTEIPHDTIYQIPFFRLQAGLNAVIIDPQVGDVGMCGFCDRDISTVKATKKRGQPGSWRQYDYADGLYFGGIMLFNKTPTQYIRFDENGITITTPIAVTVNTPTMTANVENTFTINADLLDINAQVIMNGHIMDERHTHINSGGNGTSGQVT